MKSQNLCLEFIGIRLLYLKSKIDLFATWFCISLVAIGLLILSLVNVNGTLIKEKVAISNIMMKEKTTCPPEAIATVEEGDKLTCIMKHIGPAQVTKRIEKKL